MSKAISPFQQGLNVFKKNKMAVVCAIILGIFYLATIFADLLSVYSFDNENREYSYAPPSKIQLIDQSGKLTRPFIYGSRLSFDVNHKRIYETDFSQVYPLRLFVKGDSYKILGLIPSSIHVIGVDHPGRLYFMGADARGRDIYSRIIYGGRISLSIGLLGVAISFAVGLIVGGIAGYYGGKTDEILMRLCEMFMMVPGFYLLLALRAAVPDNFSSLQIYFAIVIILSFIGWASLARIIRGMCLSLKARDYVLAAKTMGVSDMAIIVKHVLPQTISYSIITVMLTIPGYILSESALSLIGLGIQDPYASWGNMLADAMSIVRITFAPWILWPGFFIFVTVVAFNVVGDALRDSLDPMFKSEGQVK